MQHINMPDAREADIRAAAAATVVDAAYVVDGVLEPIAQSALLSDICGDDVGAMADVLDAFDHGERTASVGGGAAPLVEITLAAEDEPEPGRWVVAVYHVRLSYGGSEEGGWWYDVGSLVRAVRIVRTREQARAVRARLERHLAHTLNKGLPRKSSVASSGVYEAHIFPETAPQGFPAQRPHYE